jgi:hypothetical protein
MSFGCRELSRGEAGELGRLVRRVRTVSLARHGDVQIGHIETTRKIAYPPRKDALEISGSVAETAIDHEGRDERASLCPRRCTGSGQSTLFSCFWQPNAQLQMRLSHCQWFSQHVTPALGEPARQDSGHSGPEKGLEQRIDFQRVGWLGAFGALIYAPTNHLWFAWQERYVTAFKTRPAAQAALRVGVHSAAYAPFSVAAFIAWVAFLEVRIHACVVRIHS